MNRPSPGARRALKEFEIEGVATVLPFHRAAMESRDFTGEEGFRVHTRWIETDFSAPLANAARPEPLSDQSLIRTHVEIDGKRHELALPAILFSRMGPITGGQPVAAP